MKHWWLTLLLIFVCVPLARANGQTSDIHIVSEIWRDYSNADGSGLAWDVLRKVFEPAGLRLRIQSVPYTRSVGLVQRGEADAWVGAYRDEVDKAIYPKWHYDNDHVVALGLVNTPVPSLANLNQYRLAWMHGYGFQKYLPNVREYREVQRRNGILGMLELGYADLYIDSITEVEDVLRTAPKPYSYRVTALTDLPLLLGFSATPRGRQLAAVFDQRMAHLVASGELRPIFERWQQPYPF
ncbi:ABC transporter substrate-binding protein [Pseudomonas sp. 8Z]|uniref:substrate-binding periplasmic protein n=1 Tax=Pseudomonas sp. 8Z TaxID=2653166 RepID=UPI0012F05DAC|nr:transporter substrate-binding domain-containing protein [Pseudomonas sp. 8Z]VXC82422.1 ABC transporter substrate-binding protein [Pseudomonas sp. 8Z]